MFGVAQAEELPADPNERLLRYVLRRVKIAGEDVGEPDRVGAFPLVKQAKRIRSFVSGRAGTSCA